MANIVLDALKSKGVVTTFSLNKGDVVSIDGFNISQAKLFVNDLGQLVILLKDGTEFLLSNFSTLLAEFPQNIFLQDSGDLTSYSGLISKYVNADFDIEPALGESNATVDTTDNSRSGSSYVPTNEGSTTGTPAPTSTGVGGGNPTVVPGPGTGTDTPGNPGTPGAPETSVLFSDDLPPFVDLNSNVNGSEENTFNLNIQAPTDDSSDVADLLVTILGIPNPSEGVVSLGGVPVTAGQTMTVAELTSLTFTGSIDFFGTTNVTYNVSDGTNTSDEATHTITVNNVNDIPVVNTSTSFTINEDDTDVNAGMVNPTDADGDTLVARIDTLPTEGILKFADGSLVQAGQSFLANELANLTFTANADFNGNVAIDYFINDNVSAEIAATHTLTVTAVNDAPVADDSSSSQNEDSSLIALGIPAPTDIEGDVLNITINSLPASGTLTYANGTIVLDTDILTVADLTGLTFTPAADFNGDLTFSYNVNDGLSTDLAVHTITINPENDPPVTFNSTSTQDEDSININLGINTPTDIDGDALTSIIGLPVDGTLSFADGSLVQDGISFSVNELAGIRFTPSADFNGVVVINYSVTDGELTTPGTHTVTVTSINDVPVVTNSTSTSVEDSSDTSLSINIPVDADGDALTATVAVLPTEGTLSFANGTLVAAGVSFAVAELSGLTFTPNANFAGDVTINYTVSDGLSPEQAGSHTVTVTAVNDAPVASNSSSTQDEDSSNVTIGIPLPVDVDGDSLTALIGVLPTEGTLRFADASLVVANTTFDAAELAGLTFTPNAGFTGNVDITYIISDGEFDTNATHTIGVNNTIDFPTIADTASTQDEDTIAFDLNIPTPIDSDGDPLTVTINAIPTDGELKLADGTLLANGDTFSATLLNNLTFTPNANFNGQVSLDYSVTDGSVTLSATHTINITSVNDAPMLSDSSSSMVEDSSAIALGIALPTDVEGDLITVRVDTLPLNGTLTFANGSSVPEGIEFDVNELDDLLFTPNADFAGTISLDYTAIDANGDTSSATHTITVTNTPDAPFVVDSSASLNEDTTGGVGISAPLDADGDAMTAIIATLPTDGVLKFANGSNVPENVSFNANELAGLVFTPNANFNGDVTINYTVSDGSVTVSAEHTLTVTAVNDAPDTVDSNSTQGEDSVNITLNILAPTDAEGDSMTAVINTLPVDGTLRFANGSAVAAGVSFDSNDLAGLMFTPNADFSGTVNFSYEVTDGQDSSVSTHTILVSSGNDAPVVSDSTSSQNEDSLATVLNIPTPVDTDGDSMTVQFTSLPSNAEGVLRFGDGTLVTNAAFDSALLSSITFTPVLNFNGNVVLNMLVSDGFESSTATHTITVNNVNDAPTSVNSSSTQVEDSENVGLGIPTPTDIDGDVLRSTINSLPTAEEGVLKFANGTLVLAGVSFVSTELAGLTFTPADNFNGSVSISYTVGDGVAAESTYNHTVNVTGVNDAPVTVNSTSTQEDGSIAVDLNIVNPTDADGDSLTAKIATLPTAEEGVLQFANGSLVLAGVAFNAALLSDITFTPNEDFTGDVTIHYTVTDGLLTTPGVHVATVTLVNVAPIAENTTSSQIEDSGVVALNITAPTDLDGDDLEITFSTLPASEEGILKLANGTIVNTTDTYTISDFEGLTFTPADNYNGEASFSYLVNDGLLTDTATHTITVTPVNDEIIVSPTPFNDTVNTVTMDDILRREEAEDGVPSGTYQTSHELPDHSIITNTSLVFALPNDSFIDPDGGVITYSGTYTYNGTTADVSTINWLSVDPSTGNLTGNIPSNILGSLSINIIATSSTGETGVKTITYNVIDENTYNNFDVIAGTGDLVGKDGTSDLLIGRGGDAFLVYEDLSAGITADLNNDVVYKAGGNKDLVDGYDGIVGTDHADRIIAKDGADNYIITGQGNDVVVAGTGKDIVEGSTSLYQDTISHENSSSAVNVNLAARSGSGGTAANDQYVFMDNVIGSDHNDTITGDRYGNVLEGGAGSDSIYGGTGSDTIIFDENDNILDGGNKSGTSSEMDVLKLTSDYSSSGNSIDLTNITIRGIEMIDMNNGVSGEDLSLNVGSLLSTSQNNELYIKGDITADGGITSDDSVQISDKTIDQLEAAESGYQVVGGVTYQAFNFGSGGMLYIEQNVDVLDMNGAVL